MSSSHHLHWIAAARRQFEAAPSAPPFGGSSAHPGRPGGLRGAAPPALPGYTVVRELSRGGQGVVFEAIQRSTGRTVAVKVLRDGAFVRDLDLVRFDREVSTLARLSHPNIVGVVDRGEADGRCFFAMDYIDGRPLDRWAAETNAGLRRRLTTFAALCDAVNAAHLRGVIHRDLKPSNVLIDGADTPHILDFGLAKPTDAAEAALPAETVTGQFVGSLPWASPEQLDSAGGPPDTRTDLYSLGVMLHQLLTGQFPYPVVGSAAEVLENILHAEPSPPSRRRDAHDWGDERLDVDLDTICLKCLQKDRESRYQSAGELARDVRHWLAGEPIDARRDSLAYVIRRSLRRHRAPIAAAAAFLFLVLAAGVVSTIAWRQAAAQRDRAVAAKAHEEQARRRADAEAAKALAVNGFLQQMLSAANPEQARNPDLSVKEALDTAAAKVEAGSLADQPDVEVDVRKTIGASYWSLGLYEQAETHYRRGLESVRERYPGDHEYAGEFLYALGETHRAKGDFDAAEQSLRDAAAMFARLSGEDSAAVGQCLNELAIIAKTRGDLDAAEDLYRRSLQIVQRVFGPEHDSTLACINNLSMVVAARGRLDEAETMQRDVLAIRRRTLGDDHPGVAFSLNSLATLVKQRGNLQEAEALYRDALAVRRKILGAEHPDLALSLSNLAVLLEGMGRYDESIELHREALVMRRKLLGDNHLDTAVSLNNLGYALFHKGDYDAAEPLLRQAVDVIRRIFGDGHGYVAGGLWNLADLLTKKGDHVAAEAVLREVLAGRLASQGDSHLDTATARATLGACLIRQNRAAEAEPLLAACVAAREAQLPPSHLLIGIARGLLGEALMQQVRFADAEPLVLSAAELLAVDPAATRQQRLDTTERAVRLYEEWEMSEPGVDRSARADEWRARLQALSAPEPEVPPATNPAVDRA